MADKDTFYGKQKKRPFFIALGGDRSKVVRIVAASEDEALELSDKIDPRTATMVALDQSGNPLIRGNDALMQLGGKQMLVGEGYSTSDPQKIEEFVGGASTQQLGRTMQQEALLQEEAVGARGAAMLPATMFGVGSWGDEIVDKLFGGNTKRYVDAMRMAMEEQKPLETFLLQAGVGMFDARNALKAFPQLASVFGRDPSKSILANTGRAMLAGATGAGIPAGIQAAGDAPSGQRIIEGLKTGGIAAGMGAGVSAAGPFVAAGAQNLANFIKQSENAAIASALGISKSAAMVIKSAFAQGGDINTAIANVMKAGENGMLADAGVAARALADAAGQAGPAPAQTIATNVGKRAEAVKGQLDQTLLDTLGDPLVGPRAAVKAISDRTKDARSTAYNRAYNTPIDYSTGGAGERIMSVVNRVDKKTLTAAVEEANADMLADGVTNKQIMARLDANGNVIDFIENMNVQQLDYLKRALQTLAENNRDPATYKFTPQGRRYSRLASDLRRELGEGIVDPETGAKVYDDAVKLGGNTIAEENAFKLGQDLLKPKTQIEDVLETLGDDPSEAQMEAVRMGLSQYVRKVLNDVRAVPSDPDLEARQLDAFYRLTSSQNARDKITEVMGDQAEAFLKQIDEVGQAALVRAQVGQNSLTAIRQSTQKGIEDMTQAGPATSLLRGQPLEATRKLVSELTGFTDELAENQRMAIYNDVAKALTEVGTSDALRALNIMRDVQMGRRVSQEERDFAFNRAVYYLGSAVQKPTEQQALEATGQKPVSGLPKMGLGLLVP